MKSLFINLLKSFEFEGINDFIRSLAPSIKYHLTIFLFSVSAIAVGLQQITGLQAMAFVAFLVVMAAELISGIRASAVANKGKFHFSSQRFSRFLFKLFYYLALLFICQSMKLNYETAGKHFTAEIFDWLHTYLVVHICGENIISILENIATIEGKPKIFYLEKIKSTIGLFKD